MDGPMQYLHFIHVFASSTRNVTLNFLYSCVRLWNSQNMETLMNLGTTTL